MLISATVLPDLLGPRKIPVHGTRGTTGSEGCLLLYSAVGNSLIFPMTLFLCLTCQIRRGEAAAPEAQDHEQGGAQVGHGGVSLAWAREFEVYGMVVHFRMSGNDSLDVICSMLCAFAADQPDHVDQRKQLFASLASRAPVRPG